MKLVSRVLCIMNFCFCNPFSVDDSVTDENTKTVSIRIGGHECDLSFFEADLHVSVHKLNCRYFFVNSIFLLQDYNITNF